MPGTSDQTGGGRAIPFVALLLAIGLLSVAIAAAAADHGRERDSLQRALRAEVEEQAQVLENYFARARSLTQITANNPAYREFYEAPGAREAKVRGRVTSVREAEQGLAYLEDLFPGSIGEACFIDRAGPENARAVHGKVEPLANLSADETGAPFFEPTFGLQPGQVYQSEPYLSPDTHDWVVSNSSPVPSQDGRVRGIVHFEITIESFRAQAAETSDRFDIAIVEAHSGQVVADSRFRQPPGEKSKLGRPGDRRFARFFATAGGAFAEGTAEVGGRESAFESLTGGPNNDNEWVVVASARTPASAWIDEIDAAEAAMIGLALLLLSFAVLSFRASQAQLRSAALSDPLTGLHNRRKLVADLEARLAGASAERPVLLALYDLDGFKAYNDSFGHPAGDALLVRLSAALREAVAGHGSAYRMGGDEFCVLARVEPDTADELLEAAGAALSEHGEGFTIGASHGSILLPLEAGDAAEALRLADQRMYAEKSGGRASAGRQTTDVLVRVLAERYPDLGTHLDDVTGLCGRVADALGVPRDERMRLLQAASLHDVGKAAVPDAILSKAGPLDQEEWAFMRQHTVIGERILAAAPALSGAARLVRWSHERIDGSGYPDGLAGEEIPLGARIIAVCDAYDAMTSSRPYRPTPMSREGALAELRRMAGTQFDPAVVEAFAVALVPEELPSAPQHSLTERSR